VHRLRGECHHDVRLLFRFLDHQAVIAKTFNEHRVLANGMDIECGCRRAQAGINLADRQQDFGLHAFNLATIAASFASSCAFGTGMLNSINEATAA